MVSKMVSKIVERWWEMARKKEGTREGERRRWWERDDEKESHHFCVSNTDARPHNIFVNLYLICFSIKSPVLSLYVADEQLHCVYCSLWAYPININLANCFNQLFNDSLGKSIKQCVWEKEREMVKERARERVKWGWSSHENIPEYE